MIEKSQLSHFLNGCGSFAFFFPLFFFLLFVVVLFRIDVLSLVLGILELYCILVVFVGICGRSLFIVFISSLCTLFVDLFVDSSQSFSFFLYTSFLRDALHDAKRYVIRCSRLWRRRNGDVACLAWVWWIRGNEGLIFDLFRRGSALLTLAFLLVVVDRDGNL